MERLAAAAAAAGSSSNKIRSDESPNRNQPRKHDGCGQQLYARKKQRKDEWVPLKLCSAQLNIEKHGIFGLEGGHTHKGTDRQTSHPPMPIVKKMGWHQHPHSHPQPHPQPHQSGLFHCETQFSSKKRLKLGGGAKQQPRMGVWATLGSVGVDTLCRPEIRSGQTSMSADQTDLLPTRRPGSSKRTGHKAQEQNSSSGRHCFGTVPVPVPTMRWHAMILQNILGLREHSIESNEGPDGTDDERTVPAPTPTLLYTLSIPKENTLIPVVYTAEFRNYSAEAPKSSRNHGSTKDENSSTATTPAGTGEELALLEQDEAGSPPRWQILRIKEAWPVVTTPYSSLSRYHITIESGGTNSFFFFFIIFLLFAGTPDCMHS
ncbi:hypothetical protein MBM_02435 [Drepanopeziza brunnea f. sp. 'multigermtubi' MB_m1]|uniref:Uncharacterized protein n=1 Tax=Marssonina brunnea f. sp. multigermtubi (strain MB_m1) TaxID=1072389 RepID=K1XED4_MARBU|nr:uncharacterized protein MBM_02435 [Drepanopeziza brunnea f. sp. 'multigermtubi' MB_m1]EKD19198.1 hypothetical protein MBM_02435 [Drepanopeziza brunnea f. sp. 'multigermtubi' MB_m1]